MLQDPRRPSFLILPVVVAASALATLLFATSGVNLSSSEVLAFNDSRFGSVLLEGESTSDPADGWNTYTGTVASALSNSTVTSDGVSGATIDDVNGEGSRAALVSDADDVAVLWIGINDMAEANNPAVVYSQMATWTAARRAEGWEHIVILTVPKFEAPRSLDANSWGSHELADNARIQLNEMIVLNQAGADVVVDMRGVAGLGDAFSVEDQQWRSDKVHFTQAGYSRVAGLVLEALAEL